MMTDVANVEKETREVSFMGNDNFSFEVSTVCRGIKDVCGHHVTGFWAIVKSIGLCVSTDIQLAVSLLSHDFLLVLHLLLLLFSLLPPPRFDIVDYRAAGNVNR